MMELEPAAFFFVRFFVVTRGSCGVFGCCIAKWHWEFDIQISIDIEDIEQY